MNAQKKERPDKIAKLYIETLASLDDYHLADLLKEGDIEIITSRKGFGDYANTLAVFFAGVIRILENHGPLVRNKTFMINVISDELERARSQ